MTVKNVEGGCSGDGGWGLELRVLGASERNSSLCFLSSKGGPIQPIHTFGQGTGLEDGNPSHKVLF